MLKIGDFSILSRISIRMLRHYDATGLLVPETTDPYTGYRYYSESQLPLANRINALRDMGFGISTVAEILTHYGEPSSLRRYLEIKRTELTDQAAETNRRLLLLKTAIERLGKDGKAMTYNVTRKTFPEQYVASLRKTIPTYQHEGELWTLMMQELAPLHVQYGNPCYTRALFHDEGFKEENVDVEIQHTVTGRYSDTEHVKFKTVPAVEIASATFKGSYELVSEVNEAVANWICDNGYEISGGSFCIYHVSPHETDNPDELVTEVCYPIVRRCADGR